MGTKTVRPKRYFMMHYCGWRCVVEFKPQQKWKLNITRDGQYSVSRDNTEVYFDKEEFENNFKVVE